MGAEPRVQLMESGLKVNMVLQLLDQSKERNREATELQSTMEHKTEQIQSSVTDMILTGEGA